MYLQLTTRCNYTCAHCCFACGKAGEDMPRETFAAAIQIAQDHGEYITLGGGEPTLHREFSDFLDFALRKEWEIRPLVVTNGTNRRVALKLARMAQEGAISAALSRSRWHREQRLQPAPEVVEAFTPPPRPFGLGYGVIRSDLREIRVTPEHQIAAIGRAADWGDDNQCCCDNLFVTPDGRLWSCGHRDESFGTVHDPRIPNEYWQRDTHCSRFKADADDDAMAEDDDEDLCEAA